MANPLVCEDRVGIPSSSVMPDVSAVSVWPVEGKPVMPGVPVAGVLAARALVAVLVSDSSLPASSAKVTPTLIALPSLRQRGCSRSSQRC